jgi:hypothetical protein
MPYPFEVPFEEVQENLDHFVGEVFSARQSDFLTMPKSEEFVKYSVFEQGCETLIRPTAASREDERGVQI